MLYTSIRRFINSEFWYTATANIISIFMMISLLIMLYRHTVYVKNIYTNHESIINAHRIKIQYNN